MAEANLLENASLKDKSQAKLSFWEKFSYGMGGGAEVLMANILFKLAMPIYNVGLGIDAALLGIWLLIPRLWDAFGDPLIGNISDNTRSRWGRRHPYILFGTIFTGIFCMLLWMPPRDASNTVQLTYFAVISMLFFTSYAIFYVPFNALGYEMSGNYDERTSIMAYRWSICGVAGAVFLPGAYWACTWFGGEDEVAGARVVGVLVGAAIIFFGLFTTFFCRERFKDQNQPKIPFLKSLACCAKNKPFVLLCGIIMTCLAGVFIADPLRFYVNMAYVTSCDKAYTGKVLFYYDIVYIATTLAAIPVITYLTKRFGKKEVLAGGLALVALGFASSWFYITPKMPYLQAAFAVVIGTGMSCLWVITSSCIADVCDIDELATGLRREGMYGAVFSWLMKSGVAVMLGLGGFMIKWSGFTVGEVSPQTIMYLRCMYAFSPLVFLIAAIVLTIKYPVTRKTISELQSLLAERRNKKDNSSTMDGTR